MNLFHPGFVFYALGIILAITCAAKMANSHPWPDSLPMFIVGTVVSTIGLYLWRRRNTADNKTESKIPGHGGALEKILDILVPLQSLKQKITEMECAQICENLEPIFINDINPVIEAKDLLISRLGMSRGAEVLLAYSQGERILNRVYTAALDHHKPEALDRFPEALDGFQNAAALYRKYCE